MSDLSDLMATILAANIRTLRNRVGPTQVEFAEKIGVSQGTVARWESGAKPDYDHVVRMAGMAGTTVQEFTGQLMTAERRQFIDDPPGVLLLPVQLPSEGALAQMFEALLETMPANSELSETAQKLAQLLPSALARTVSHPQAGSDSPDQQQPPLGDREGSTRAGRVPPRAPRT